MVEESSSQPITLSFGDCKGAAFESMWKFMQTILESGICVRTVNEGKIYSAAAYLFLAGTERSGTEDSEFYFHPVLSNFETFAIDSIMDDAMVLVRKTKEIYSKVMPFLVERTRLPWEEVRTICNDRKFKYFDLELARTVGIVNQPAKVLA
jgi:ATP-dependent protease ClpP protease subunit